MLNRLTLYKKSFGMKFMVLLTCLFTFVMSGCAIGGRNNFLTSDKVTLSDNKGKEKEQTVLIVEKTIDEKKPEVQTEKYEGTDTPPSLDQHVFSKTKMSGVVDGKKQISYTPSTVKSQSIPVIGQNKINTDEPRVHVELAFDNADLYEVLDLTLYELYELNYMIDPSIKAKVTFHVAGDYTEKEFLNLLGDVLQLNNLTIAGGDGSMIKIVRRNASASIGTLTIDKDEMAGDITRFVRLRYISSATANRNIKPFLSKGASLIADPVNNALILTDTKDNIDKAVGILTLLDVPYFSDILWRIFPIMETNAADIAKDLTRVMKAGGLFNRPGANTGSFQIIPIKTMNAVFVLTRWPSIMKLIEDWIFAMDTMDESGTGVYVYFVENGNAVELSDILKQVYGATASSSNSSKRTTIVRPTAKATSKRKTITGQLSGDVEIIPDETNNAIVFKASPSDYKIIKRVLKQLDIVPRQVLLNVVVSEVKLTNETKYGVEWFLKGGIDKYSSQSILGDGEIRGNTEEAAKALKALTGFSYALFDGEDVLRGLVTALGKNANLSILSAPNVLVVDNQEANIEVGEEVPTETGSITTDTSAVTRTVQFKKIGVILKVTPQINSSGLVKLDVSQEVSSMGTYDKELKNYSYLTRKVTTTLVAEDGQTIIIGGMIRKDNSNSDTGIPFLKDIPIIGYLFKSETKKVDKNELIFLITPHVISNRKQADRITREFSRKLHNAKELVNNLEK
ncbi:MAG: type II secretion system protein GspD [Desulfobacteraceae bacterium 4572_19]|nr:MAG: type II secretion system protein GspD [Desulfobacteraceae bacterium 4572_19]